MTYQEALSLIKSEFNTRRNSDCCEIIRTGRTLDGCNGFCVSVYDTVSEVIITDLGETKEVFEEVSEEEWEEQCKSHGFEFRHRSIVKPFTSLYDVYDFIDFIEYIANTYCTFDDFDG